MAEHRVPAELSTDYGVLFVEAMLNGQRDLSYRLLVDTGATYTAFLPEVIREFQLPALRSTPRIASGAPQATETTLYGLNILGLVLRRSPLQVLESENLEVTDVEWPRSLGVHGLLGMDVLKLSPRVCLNFEDFALEVHTDL